MIVTGAAPLLNEFVRAAGRNEPAAARCHCLRFSSPEYLDALPDEGAGLLDQAGEGFLQVLRTVVGKLVELPADASYGCIHFHGFSSPI